MSKWDAFVCIHRGHLMGSIRFRAFSLVELLVVMAIIGILVTASIPAVGGLTSASRRTQFLSNASNLLGSARQYAVANNTYAWVAFGEKDDSLYAVAVSSTTGLSQGYGPEDVWSEETFNLQNTDEFAPITRIIKLGEYTLTSVIANFSSRPGFQTKQGGDGDLDLSRSVQFSPSGEARIGPGLRGNLTFKAKAISGQFADRDETIIVNGPTGFVSIISTD